MPPLGLIGPAADPLTEVLRRGARDLDYLGIDRRGIDACLGATRLVVFTGHMLDRPDRAGRPRFPAELAPLVVREIRQRLEQLGAGIGYTSATAGADILFLEAMRDIGGETHVVLPYDRRLENLNASIAQASTTLRAGQHRADGITHPRSGPDLVCAHPLLPAGHGPK